MKILYLSSVTHPINSKVKDYLKLLCIYRNIDVITQKDYNPKYIIEDYDLGISFLWHQKIKYPHLYKPWLNFHPGPLPEYGGRNLCYHAIMNEAKQFGGTIHWMNEEFDRGDIIEVKKFDIKEEDTAGDLLEETYLILFELLTKYIPLIIDGEKLSVIEQKQTIYYPKTKLPEYLELTPEQIKLFKALYVEGKFEVKVKINNKEYILHENRNNI